MIREMRPISSKVSVLNLNPFNCSHSLKKVNFHTSYKANSSIKHTISPFYSTYMSVYLSVYASGTLLDAFLCFIAAGSTGGQPTERTAVD